MMVLSPIFELLAQTDPSSVPARTIAPEGIGLGSAIAVVCSRQRNESILWAILTGVLSWFYVIYFAITRRPEQRN